MGMTTPMHFSRIPLESVIIHKWSVKTKVVWKTNQLFYRRLNWTYAQILRTFAFANQQAAFSSIQSLFELVINGVGVEWKWDRGQKYIYMSEQIFFDLFLGQFLLVFLNRLCFWFIDFWWLDIYIFNRWGYYGNICFKDFTFLAKKKVLVAELGV